MAKAKDAFRTISEVAEWLDTPTHVLRFWESKFAQIKPVKGAGGRRYYRPADIDLIAGIKQLLHVEGLTIKGTQKLLREKGVKHVAQLGQSFADAPASTQNAMTPANSVTAPEAVAVTAPPVSATDSPPARSAPAQDSFAFDAQRPTKAENGLPPGLPSVPPRLLGHLPKDIGSLRPKSAQIAPLLAQLEALRDGMAG